MVWVHMGLELQPESQGGTVGGVIGYRGRGTELMINSSSFKRRLGSTLNYVAHTLKFKSLSKPQISFHSKPRFNEILRHQNFKLPI